MKINKLMLGSVEYPMLLREISSPPKQLYVAGEHFAELLMLPRVAIVGSRKMTRYGAQVTHDLATRLAERGIVIISGLAYGVDAAAHRATVAAGGRAIAVLPGPLEAIVPAVNRRLAQEILDNGGALVSEYSAGEPTFKKNFIARNRIVSGLAKAVVITEATEKSGSLYTANFALKQNREVLAVPGEITTDSSAGTNNLIKTGRAATVTSYADVLYALQLTDQLAPKTDPIGRNAYEQCVLDLMQRGITDAEDLLEQSRLDVSQFSQVLTMLEIGGKIRPLGANHWVIF